VPVLAGASGDGFYPDPSVVDGNAGDDDAGPTTAARMERFRRDAPDLAAAACEAALIDAATAPADVTDLIIITCTGFAAPGLTDALIRRLGLSRGVRPISIGFMGCHAAINGFHVARALAVANPLARVLMCSVELCSLHFQYGWHAQRNVANAIFADGAAAVVVGQDDARAPSRWRLVGTASRLIDGTEDDMSWHVGDHGFVMTLSPRVPRIVSEHLRPWLDDWLGGHGRTVESIGSWAIHAGGPRIVSAVADRLGLSPAAAEPARAVLRECGNMSSATVLFTLRRLRDRGATLPCVALSFGPGLVAEAALLDDN